jgi:hypothetical protein
MDATERLILENQAIILHALRILIADAGLPSWQFTTVQEQMARTQDYLERNK